MRTREEIVKVSKSFFTENSDKLILEVLLDIRELLEALVQLPPSKGRYKGGSGVEV